MRWARAFGGAWAALILLLLAASLALNVSAAVVPDVARATGRLVERVTGLPSVERRHGERLRDLTARIAAAEASAASEAARIEVERSRMRQAAARLSEREQRADAAMARAEEAMANARAASRITFRGAAMTPAEAVADTADRIAALGLAAGSASVASAYAEALPVIGIGAIAADTAAQIDASCQAQAALNELNAALDPGTSPSAAARAICAIDPPDRDTLWQAGAGDAAALWADARALHPADLPALDLGPQWQSSRGMWQALYDWAYGRPAGPPDAAGRMPSGPPASLTPGEWQ